MLTASTTTIAGFTVGAILTWFASRWFGETRLFKSAVLSATLVGANDTPVLGEVRVPSAGSLGVADTDLRPSGRARFGNDLIDAQSTGDYIARGVTIRVVSRMGSSVVVEALLTNESNTP